MNCILYLRVSSSEQVTNFSLDTQEELCRNCANRLGYTVTKTFREEGESAKTSNRPQLIALLEYCRIHKSEIHSVMVYRIDRMARETSDYLSIRKHLANYGIRLESATEPTGDSPTSKFLETIFAANAELDNAIRGERAKNGLYKRFKSGYPLGLPPLGYKLAIDGERKILVPNEPMYGLIKKAWDIMGTGTKSLGEMLGVMNELGIKITKSHVSKLFGNSGYCGIITSTKYPGEEIRGAFEPMISEELFYRVQEIIKNRRTNNCRVRLVHNPNFPLKGLVICYRCKKPLVSGNCRGHSKVYAMYWCQHCRGVKSITSEKLSEKLKELLKNLQPNPKEVDLVTLILRAKYNKRLEALESSKKTAEKDLLGFKLIYNNLVEAFVKKQVPEDIYNEQKQKLESQIMATNIVLNDSTCDKYDLEGLINFIKALLYDLPKAYEVSDYGQKRILISSIYPSGLLYEQGNLLNSPISPLWSAIRTIFQQGEFLSADEKTRTSTPCGTSSLG